MRLFGDCAQTFGYAMIHKGLKIFHTKIGFQNLSTDGIIAGCWGVQILLGHPVDGIAILVVILLKTIHFLNHNLFIFIMPLKNNGSSD